MEVFKFVLQLLIIAFSIGIVCYYRKKKEASPKKALGMGCLFWFVISIVITLGIEMFTPAEEKARIEQARKESDSINRAIEAQQQRERYIETGKSRAIVAARHYLKDRLRDPKSYEEDQYSCKWDDSLNVYIVLLRYRATNGFGGTNLEVNAFTVAYKDGEASVIDMK